MKPPTALIASLVFAALATPALADQKAVEACRAAVQQRLDANEAQARQRSSDYLTKEHHRLRDQYDACKKLVNDPPKPYPQGSASH